MAAVIRYQAIGRAVEPVTVSTSVNNGTSWKQTTLKAGQSFGIAGNVTNLLIDNVPYDPKGSYVIREGRVAQK